MMFGHDIPSGPQMRFVTQVGVLLGNAHWSLDSGSSEYLQMFAGRAPVRG